MPRLRRPSALVAGAGLAALLLTGCGDGQVRSGSAALVGDSRISTADLRGVVDRGLSDETAAAQVGADRASFQRQVLSRLVNRRVLEEAARREGVTVTAGDVDAQLAEFAEEAGGRAALDQQAAQSGISPQDLPAFVRDIVLEQALGDALTEDLDVPDEQIEQLYQQGIAEYDQVRSRHILVEDEALARSLLQQVQADPSRFAELAAANSTDTSNKDRGGELGLAGRGQFVAPFEQLLFSAPVGSFGVVQTEFGWHVVNVQERVTTSLQEATPELRRQALQEERAARTGELLRRTAEELGITVNPRYGRWNPEGQTIDPVDVPNGAASPAPGTPGQVPVETVPLPDDTEPPTQ